MIAPDDTRQVPPSPVSSAKPVSPRWALLRQPWVRLLLLALLLGFAFQGTRGLWSTDEGRYVDGALQMLESGNYLIPAYSPDRINLSKPPVTYWVIAGSIAVFGHNTWAVRLPYAAAFVLTVLLLYAMGKRLVPERSWLPGLLYACSLLPFLSANVVNTDVLLTLCEAIAALGFVQLAFDETLRSRKRGALLMWVGLGLAFLTKGPPGLILLLAAIPFLAARDGWAGLRRLFRPLGVLAFLVVGLSWYAAVVLHDPRALHDFLYREVYERIFTAALRRNPGPWGWARVYLPVLAIGALPWWPATLRGLRRGGAWRGVATWLRQRSAQCFLLLWLTIPLIVFCLAQSRLPLYILPLFLPLALLLASTHHPLVNLHRPAQLGLLAAWVVLLLALKGGVSLFAHPGSDHRVVARQLTAITRTRGYDALVFVEDVDTAYKVEERTPWGLRLYLEKPVYGMAWHGAQRVPRMCHALHANRSALLLVAVPIAQQAIHSINSHCPVRSMVDLGVWRHRELQWVRT